MANNPVDNAQPGNAGQQGLSRRDLAGLALLAGGAFVANRWWASRVDDEVGERIAAVAKRGDIEMLSSVTCAVCTKAREWFTEHGIPFAECFIERDAACAEKFARTLSPGTPALLVRGQVQVGFSPPRIAQALGLKVEKDA